MSFYVYRYMHPDYPWLYVGLTNNIRNRILKHETSGDDNIKREFLPLLLESSVYYVELNNKTQMQLVEKYLIDKYKPFLNIKDKRSEESELELKIPTWKRFIRNSDINFSDLHAVTADFKKEIDYIEHTNAALNNQIQELELIRKELEYSKQIHEEYNNNLIDANSHDNVVVIFEENTPKIKLDYIEDFYKLHPNSELYFSLKYNIGNIVKEIKIDKKGLYIIENSEIIKHYPRKETIGYGFATCGIDNYFGGLFPSSEMYFYSKTKSEVIYAL